jgi:hypothetical protein
LITAAAVLTTLNSAAITFSHNRPALHPLFYMLPHNKRAAIPC